MTRDEADDKDFIKTVSSGFDEVDDEKRTPELPPEEVRAVRDRLEGIAAARVRAQQKLRGAYVR
jgi:hypothetical protein